MKDSELVNPIDGNLQTERKGPFKLLVVSSDTYPPTRVDVSVLFGEELASRGHQIDWILQSSADCRKSYVVPWASGRVWVGATDVGASLISRLRKHALGITHDLKIFGRLRAGDYDVVQVKDKFIAGLIAVVAARLSACVSFTGFHGHFRRNPWRRHAVEPPATRSCMSFAERFSSSCCIGY